MSAIRNNIENNHVKQFFKYNPDLRTMIIAGGPKLVQEALALPLLLSARYLPKSLTKYLTIKKDPNTLFGLSASYCYPHFIDEAAVHEAIRKASKEAAMFLKPISAKKIISNVKDVLIFFAENNGSLDFHTISETLFDLLEMRVSKQFGKPIAEVTSMDAIILDELDDENSYETSLSHFECPPDVINPISIKTLINDSRPEVQELVNNLCYLACAKSIQAGYLTNTLASKVKTSNNNSETKQLSQITEKLLLEAISMSPLILERLAVAFNVTKCTVQFPMTLMDEKNQLLSNIPTKSFESFEFGQRTDTHWLIKAEGHKSYLTATKLSEYILGFLFENNGNKLNFEQMQALSDKDNWRQIGEEMGKFIRLNVIHQKSRLEQLSAINSLQLDLNGQVLGQPEAVEAMCTVVSQFFKPTNTHLGISTFLGPSGVGKTFLAEKFSESLNLFTSFGYQCKVFNMEQYVDEKESMSLFGVDSLYASAEIGQLTLAVVKHQRHIIVFDEIEKAHPNVVQSLLTLLDKGYVEDSTLKRKIDFSQCHFVFTTNLGADAISKHDGLDFDLNVVDLLTKAESNNALSAEMVNRLAAGNIVMFKKLSAPVLYQLIGNNSESFLGRSAIDWQKNVLPQLISETLASDATPRSINKQAEKLEGKLLSSALKILDKNDHHKIENMTVKIEPDPLKSPIKLMLFSNDKRICGYAAQQGILFRQASELAHIKDVISSSADGFIIDENSMTLDNQSLVQALLENPDQLFFLLAGKETSKLMAFNESNDLFQQIFSTAKRTKAVLLNELNAITSEVTQIRQLDERISRNMKANYRIEIEETNNGVNAMFRDFAFKPTLNQSDMLPFLNFDGAPDVSFEDIQGLEAAKQNMQLVVNYFNHRGNLRNRNITIPRGCILAGAPGTGKTMLAKSVANECGVSFFHVNSADLIGANAAHKINALFDVIEKNAPAILFLDEIDAIAQCRSKSSEHMRAAVNTLLVRLDGFKASEHPVFTMAATNYASSLDTALIRSGRLEMHIHCDVPTAETRKLFVKKQLKTSNCKITEEELDAVVSMTSGATIAGLSKVIRNSIYTEEKTGAEWSVNMLIEEIRTLKLGGVQENPTSSKEQLKATAYHEAGHLIAHKLLLPDAPIELVSIQARGGALGMVVPGERGHSGKTTKEDIKTHLQVLLGGLACERMIGFVGDKSSTGATDDRNRATNLAKKAISDWGMSDQFGLAIPSLLSVDANQLNTEINQWLTEAFENVTQLLKNNKPLLKTVVCALVKHETLNTEQIDGLFNDYLSSKELRLAS